MISGIKKRHIFGMLAACSLLLGDVASASSTSHTFNVEVKNPEVGIVIHEGTNQTVSSIRSDTDNPITQGKVRIENTGTINLKLSVKLGTPPNGVKFVSTPTNPGEMSVEINNYTDVVKNISNQQTHLLKTLEPYSYDDFAHNFEIAKGTPAGNYPIAVEYIVNLS
ncbi:hypothetical protein bcgnr5372_26460 [Bacillus luti]|nr:hypothetical protein [Bacillus cereus]HDR8331629.1 hypothetical protein [Bacillus cereus]HDR8335960.1 hypothetical protein [Bacillus cereus]